MKTDKRILTTFALNLGFSFFELFGGLLTGSIAIISDAVHDFGDAVSIGLSFVLERKSKKGPDEHYTYGYGRYSLLGGAITSLILLLGSSFVVYNAIHRLFYPHEIDSVSMIVFAVIGFIVNLVAAKFTHGGNSANMKAVSLHMLEDVLGWATVMIGAVIIRFTGWTMIDPLLSLLVAIFILIGTVRNLSDITRIFLERVPAGASVALLEEKILNLEGVISIHHLHVWSIDGIHSAATVHLVSSDSIQAKKRVRETLRLHGIEHVTIESETSYEHCTEHECIMPLESHSCHHHHH